MSREFGVNPRTNYKVPNKLGQNLRTKKKDVKSIRWWIIGDGDACYDEDGGRWEDWR